MIINLQQSLGRERKQNKYNPHHITIRDNWELGPDKDQEKDLQNKRASIRTNIDNTQYKKKRKLTGLLPSETGAAVLISCLLLNLLVIS